MGKVVDSSKTTEIPSSLFSFRSHRLRICLFLLLALTMGCANRMVISTAIVCMVNATYIVHHRTNITLALGCVAQGGTETIINDAFAVEGHLPWSASQRSLLLSSSFYGNFVTIIISSMVIDQLSPSKLLSFALAISGLMTVLVPTLSGTSYEAIVVSRTIIGMMESFFMPSINMLAARWFPNSEKTTLVGFYTSGIQFAAGFSSLIAAQICRSTTLHGWPAIFYLFGIVSFVLVAAWLMFVNDRPSENRWTSSAEKMHLQQNVTMPKKKPSLRSSPWRSIVTSLPVHSIILCGFAFGFSASTMQAYLPMYLREQLALPVDKIGLYTLCPFIAQIIAKFILGPLTDYIARSGMTSHTNATKIAQSLGSFGACAALLAFAFIPTCEHPEIALPILIIYGVVFAGGICGYFTSMLTIAPKYTGALTSLALLFYMLASICSSALITTLSSMDTPYKWPIIFGTASFIQVCAGVHYLFFGSTDQQKWSEGTETKASTA